MTLSKISAERQISQVLVVQQVLLNQGPNHIPLRRNAALQHTQLRQALLYERVFEQ